MELGLIEDADKKSAVRDVLYLYKMIVSKIIPHLKERNYLIIIIPTVLENRRLCIFCPFHGQ